MPKEWILNTVTNRYQLNYKRNVGAVSDEIRRCAPKDVAEWEAYYFAHVRSYEHLEQLGKTLYVKITEVVQSEIDSISEQDCMEYIVNLVIQRTYDGYVTEKQTIYGQLEQQIGVAIHPASDEWDRHYNVDFYIQVGKFYIGLQIKPETFAHAPQAESKWRDVYAQSHAAFTEKFGGKVFIVVSVKQGDRKVIHNTEVVGEIQKEIQRLSKQA